jgi:hypothetical protein
MLYLTFGTQQVMDRGFRVLDQRLELYLDGVRAELPSIESVVVLNIPSWGAGVHLWDMGASMLNIFYVSCMRIKNIYNPYENMLTGNKNQIQFWKCLLPFSSEPLFFPSYIQKCNH